MCRCLAAFMLVLNFTYIKTASSINLTVTYENLLSIVFILPYNKLWSLMNTEWGWKYSTSFIFKGLDSFKDFFVESGTSAHRLGAFFSIFHSAQEREAASSRIISMTRVALLLPLPLPHV